ncbi:V-type proton ATPase subunit S1 [Augochlora pura]
MTQFCSVFSLTFTLIIAAQVSLLYANDAVPVLIWGGAGFDSERHSINPFLKTTRKEFDSFLHEKLEGLPPVLLFVKRNLCVEDLIKHKQLLHSTITGDSFYYYPAVETAVNVIEDLPSYNTTYADYTDAISEGQLSVMTISNLDVVPQTYEALKESSPNLTAILTGRLCSYRQSERVKRDVTENDTNAFTLQTARVLFYASEPLLLKIPQKNKPVQLLNPKTKEIKDDGEFILNLIYGELDDLTLSFKFENRSGYYTLNKIILLTNPESSTKNTTNVTLTSSTNIVFASKFSYHCSYNTTFQKDDTHVLTIKNFQVQIFNEADPAREARFSDAYDCVGFTTIPIWTGIFVTSILGLILIWGLTMIMDIRTMDRFDDPKGKTIAVSAQE